MGELGLFTGMPDVTSSNLWIPPLVGGEDSVFS